MDVPYPPIYGGIIDVFYCVKGFSDAGYDVHLHCYEYGRGESEPLRKYCKSVSLYKRDMSGKHLLNAKPFIVATRNSKELLKNLAKDDYPVLLEGLHCTSILNKLNKTNKHICVRTHNIEHEYYDRLAEVEINGMKKVFFQFEAFKLKYYENILKKADSIAAISKTDYKYFSSKYHPVAHVSAFHPYSDVDVKPGLGEYALYHGNMTVGENINAALFLINEVFSRIDYPFIIAGNNPDLRIVNAAEKLKNVSLRANVSMADINELIQNAQINILPTFQATGIKLKLLAALHKGRWCIVNTPMVENTGLENLCIVKDQPADMMEALEEFSSIEFPEEAILDRKETLLSEFGNETGIRELVRLLYK